MIFNSRRKSLIDALKEQFKQVQKTAILLFADFENPKFVFRQESSFYYLTGVTEPGAVFVIYFDGDNVEEVLYLPDYGGVREKWVSAVAKPEESDYKTKKLGDFCKGYFITPLFKKEKYSTLLEDLKQRVDDKTFICTLLDETGGKYFYQRQIYSGLVSSLPQLQKTTINIADIVHEMRKRKNKLEVDLIFKAIQITQAAHESACTVIKPKCTENEIQAMIEAIFTRLGAQPAFPSIVAFGKNTTILHYMSRNQTLKSGDLVLIDIGAEYNYYAADLTRTYPVSGKFNKRQAQVYNIVLETQAYVESIAKPGMFLNNPDEPEKSLQHLAVKFLKTKGFDQYFAHGIGHYLGLDVHDVGDYKQPLNAGDVFTIEPGIYIPEENLGIRIEDNFLMTDEGAVCLSYDMPKKIDEIEALF